MNVDSDKWTIKLCTLSKVFIYGRSYGTQVNNY